jgi:hypothetical protein
MGNYNPRWDRDDDRHEPGHDERVDDAARCFVVAVVLTGLATFFATILLQ